MSPINLDPDLSRKLDQGMRSGSTVDLPFPAPYIWAHNGQASYKSQGGALYYGGWACKTDDIASIADQLGLTVPQGWSQVTIATRDGDEFEAFITRSLTVAPIGKRLSWLHDGKRSADYVEGGRRHLQVLCYLAELRGENGSKQYAPWGPVVLTAKGYQARNLLDAFAKWEKASAQVRWKVAPGVPAWCFYITLGTFGRERQTANVGKPGAQSPITPILPIIPDKLNEQTLSSLFVGDEVAALMSDLQDQSQDWLRAWRLGSPVEPEDELENGLTLEGEIPF